jgi:hypothetical protein
MSTKLNVYGGRQERRTVDAVIRGDRVECGATGHLLMRLNQPGLPPVLSQQIKCHGCGAMNAVGPWCRVL